MSSEDLLLGEGAIPPGTPPPPRRSKRLSATAHVNYAEVRFRDSRSPTPGKISRKLTPGRAGPKSRTSSTSSRYSSVSGGDGDWESPPAFRGLDVVSEDEDDQDEVKCPSMFALSNLNKDSPRVLMRNFIGNVKKGLQEAQNNRRKYRKMVIFIPCLVSFFVLLALLLLLSPNSPSKAKILNNNYLNWDFPTNMMENCRLFVLVVPEFISSLVVNLLANTEISGGNENYTGEATLKINYDLIITKLISNPKFEKMLGDISKGNLEDFARHSTKVLAEESEKFRQEIREQIKRNYERISSSSLNKVVSDGELKSQVEELKSQLRNLEEDLKINQQILKGAIKEEYRSLIMKIKDCCSNKTDLSSIKALVNQTLDNFVQQVTGSNPSSKISVDFLNWINENYQRPGRELDERLENLYQLMRRDIRTEVDEAVRRSSTSLGSRNDLVTSKSLNELLQSALNKYDADKTGMFDFALESAGGTIASTRCTETYDISNAVYSVWGIAFWWERNNPRTILQPGSSPGQCWAFRGSQGSVVIQLSGYVRIQAVTLEHIPKTLAPNENIKSAPKDFTVLGLKSLDDPNPYQLGNFTYRDDYANPVQTFYLLREDENPVVNMVELKILSNHGHMTYTCLYRFRVHGTYQGFEPKH